ncbi:MAG: CNNM domain-containing protein [Nitrososphaerales archaeon]|jgi:CBS domain containing-hemolysin-like protein
MDPVVFIPLCAALILSFWVSLIEATYLTVRPAPLRLALEAGDSRAGTAINLTNDKTRLVSTTTFVDTFSNVVIATTVGLILSSMLGDYGWIISAVFGSLLIMIFLYLLPKAMGIENSVKMSILLAPSSNVLLGILSPVAVPLTSFAARLSRRIISDRSSADSGTLVNEFEDFLILLERAGHVAPNAGKVIRSALSSSRSLAGDFVTPEQEIVSIQAGSNVLEALKVMGESSHPHLPIRDGNPISYVGAVTFGSLSPAMAKGKFSDSILNYSVQPARVDANDATVTVMDRMQAAKVTMAFVYQGEKILGLVTLTDILEVVLGLKV